MVNFRIITMIKAVKIEKINIMTNEYNYILKCLHNPKLKNEDESRNT